MLARRELAPQLSLVSFLFFACMFSSGLTAKAYRLCGQAASALHAMALLKVHQAQVLMDMHKGGSDPELLRELSAATDLALRAMKETAHSVGQAMSSMVNLADMRETDTYWFLDSPFSQVGLFGDPVESFTQQFSAAQKQANVIRHILPRRTAAACTCQPAADPLSVRRYAIQFTCHTLALMGIQFNRVLADNAHVFQAEIAVLLVKDAIQPVPPANMKTSFSTGFTTGSQDGRGRPTSSPLETPCLVRDGTGPFEPLQSAELKIMSWKTVLLLALASIKRVGDLHAFLVNKSCREFGLANSHVILRPLTRYVPMVPTTPFQC